MKSQKELKELYRGELAKAWDSPKMIDFCSKNSEYIIEYNGRLFDIEKPRINKDFCFGYGQNGQSADEEEDRAMAMVGYARESESYFIEQNLKEINNKIERLEKILKDMSLDWAENNYPSYMLEIRKRYTGQDADCKLSCFCTFNTWDVDMENKVLVDTELLKAIIEGYEVVRTSFTKRLNAYLKRYGTTKVRSWSYLSD